MSDINNLFKLPPLTISLPHPPESPDKLTPSAIHGLESINLKSNSGGYYEFDRNISSSTSNTHS